MKEMKSIVVVIIVVALMLTTVTFTGCIGASTATPTAVIAPMNGATNIKEDPYPLLTEVNAPTLTADGKCIMRNPDKSISICTSIQEGIAGTNPGYPTLIKRSKR